MEKGGKPLFTNVLIVICVLSVISSLSLLKYTKSTERKFKKDRAVLVKEKMELKDQLDSLKDDMRAKADAVAALEAEKSSMANEIVQLKKDTLELAKQKAQELESLKTENELLSRKAEGSKSSDLGQLIRSAIAQETDENIKRVLADALAKIDMVKEGSAVSLEPIVVKEGEQGAGPYGRKQGKILSVDRKDSLAVVDLGRVNGIAEGQRCTISDGQENIGTGAIVRTRYKISALFINRLQPKHTIKDIKEGLRVTIE